MAIVCAVAIVSGLVIDQCVPYGQVIVDVGVAALFCWLLASAGRRGRGLLLSCLLFASAGELFLSLGWGLYDYRLGNVPLFVPPGHALLLLLGMAIAARVPDGVVVVVPIVALPVVVWQAVAGIDRFGVLLFLLLVVAVWRGSARKLYAVMFVLAWVMEVLGTSLGNWQWRASAPWLQVPVANPPLCAGAFYVVLDLLVMTAWQRGPKRR